MNIVLYNYLSSGWVSFDEVQVWEVPITPRKAKTYSLAGQVIATRVSGDTNSSNNGLFFIYTDHLGSANTIAKHNGGTTTIMDTARFMPFGEYRGTPPTGDITKRGYTGHQENRDIGLTYMNWWIYNWSNTNRMLTPDSIIPDPMNPQSYNRYSYVRNNPIKYNDPSGHCEAYFGREDDPDCWDAYDRLRDFMKDNPEFARERERVGFDLAEAAKWDIGKISDNLKYFKKLMQMPSACWGGSNSACTTAKYQQSINSIVNSLIPEIPDALGVNISGSGSTMPVHTNAGIELVFNLRSFELTTFVVAGGGGTIGASGTIDVSGVAIYNLGKANYEYRGAFVDVNGTAALGPGATAGHAWVPGQYETGPRSYYAGASFGAGASGNLSYVEYIPLHTVNFRALIVEEHLVPYSQELFDRVFGN